VSLNLFTDPPPFEHLGLFSSLALFSAGSLFENCSMDTFLCTPPN